MHFLSVFKVIKCIELELKLGLYCIFLHSYILVVHYIKFHRYPLGWMIYTQVNKKKIRTLTNMKPPYSSQIAVVWKAPVVERVTILKHILNLDLEIIGNLYIYIYIYVNILWIMYGPDESILWIYSKASAIYQLCQLMPGTWQGQAGTSRDKAGTSRDKTGTNRDIPFPSLFVPACPYLSLSVRACPCLSLSVPVCPCLSLSVPVCLYIWYTLMSTPADEYNSLHQQYEHSYIDFHWKIHCSNAMHANHVFNFILTFHLVSSITLSFNPNSYILVMNITKGSTWFLSIFLCKLL